MFSCRRWTGEMCWNVIHFRQQLTNFHPSGRFALNKILSPRWLEKFYTSFMTEIGFITNSKRPKTTVCTIDTFFFVIKSKIKKVLSDKLHVYKQEPQNCIKFFKVSARHHKVTLIQDQLDLISKMKNQKCNLINYKQPLPQL